MLHVSMPPAHRTMRAIPMPFTCIHANIRTRMLSCMPPHAPLCMPPCNLMRRCPRSLMCGASALTSRRGTTGGSGRWAVGCWQLSVGCLRLTVDSWQFVGVKPCQDAFGWRVYHHRRSVSPSAELFAFLFARVKPCQGGLNP